MPEVDITCMASDHIGFEPIVATTRHRASGTTGTTGSIDLFVVDQDTQRGAVQIVELLAVQRPEEGGEAGETKSQSDRNEDDKTGHRAAPRSLRALPTTMIEELDMASAATSGVTIPASASGTAKAL